MKVLLKAKGVLNNPVFSNTLYLSILKGAELVLPLLTFPYLVRVLGPEYFGLIAFAVAINAYFNLITDYGFSLSATRKVSIEREDISKLNETFSSVMVIKLVFIIFCFIFLNVLTEFVPRLNEHSYIYILSFGAVIGNFLFPLWLYQGLEKMKYITMLNIVSRVIYLVLVFSIIKDKEQFWLVPLINGALSIVFGIFALYLAKSQFGIKFTLPSIRKIKATLFDGWYVFQSKLSINVYTVSTSVILGFFAGNAAVGYYSAGEKIVKATQSLYAPFGQAVYPHVCKMMSDSQDNALAFIRKVSVWVGFSMFMVSMSLFLSAEWLVQLILGDMYHQSVVVVRVLSFLPMVVALSNIYGIQTLLNMGYQKAFSLVLLFASILGVCLSVPLVYLYSGIGSAIVVISVELFVTLAMICCLLYYKVDAFPRCVKIK